MPNEKHKDPVPGGIELAKRFGKAKGYSGESGGWIWQNNGKGGPLAHGWSMFYHQYKTSILAWARSNAKRYYSWEEIERATALDLAYMLRGKHLKP